MLVILPLICFSLSLEEYSKKNTMKHADNATGALCTVSYPHLLTLPTVPAPHQPDKRRGRVHLRVPRSEFCFHHLAVGSRKIMKKIMGGSRHRGHREHDRRQNILNKDQGR